MMRSGYILWLLALPLSLFGQQQNVHENLRRSIQQRLSDLPVLQTYFTLNQSKYTPGDTLFFKAHFTNLQNEPVKGKTILEIVFFDQSGRNVFNTEFVARDGVGAGRVILPDTLASGAYRVMVMNEYQRNFNTSHFFFQQILVVRDKEIAQRVEETSRPKESQLPVQVVVGPSRGGRTLDILLSEKHLDDREVHAFVVSGQRIVYDAMLNLSDSIRFTIPQRNFTTGLYQLLVFNGSATLVGQKNFSMNEVDPVVPAVQLTKAIVNPRDSLSIIASIKDGFGNALRGSFSVSVTQQAHRHDFATHGGVSSFLRTGIQELESFAGFYNWSDLSQTSQSSLHPIRTFLYRKGSVMQNGKPLAGPAQISVFLQKNCMGYEAEVAKDGSFEMAFLFDFFGDDELFYIVQSNGVRLKDVSVEWVGDPAELAAIQPFSETSNTDRYADFAAKSRLMRESFGFYNKAKAGARQSLEANPNAAFEEEFMGADVEVKVDDYVVFPTMEDLIREVIPSLQHRKTRNGATVRVVFSVPSIIPPDDPLYIIDGVMIKQTDFFLGLKPSEIAIVKVEKDVNKLTRLGAIGKSGIVFVQTKKQEIAARARAMSTWVPVRGLQKPAVAVSSGMPRVDFRTPDFRTTLYWNPSVQTDNRGNAQLMIPLGDDLGTMDIRIEGVTEDGRPFATQTSFEVAFSPRKEN